MRPDETFARVFTEAMAYGTLIIGGRGAPGAEDVIKNQWNGYLVKDSEELKSVLRMLIKNKKRLNKMAKNCLKLVRNCYTYEHAYLKLKEIYDAILQH
jgi:glycosyltransferase involved in cell wall biosynthesis